MFIRFENDEGTGVYQSGFLEECDFDLRNFFGFMGGVTRAPTEYRGCEPGHQCRGVDLEFGDYMDRYTRFAWKLEFFRDVVSGNWTPEQTEVAKRHNWTPFHDREQYEQLITSLADFGINVIVLSGPPIYQTEQQVLFNPIHMTLVDCLGVDDVQFLMDTK